jgi:hypothetical protein
MAIRMLYLRRMRKRRRATFLPDKVLVLDI